MTMSLAELLRSKYPDIDFFTQVHLKRQDDGTDRIVMWNRAEQRPTEVDLTTWQTDPVVLENYRLSQIAKSNAIIYAKLDDIDKKSARSVREGDTQRIADWNTQAATLRAQLLK